MNFNDIVRDTVTGFKGKVTAKAQYLNSTGQIRVSAMHEGTMQEQWIDEGRLQLVAKADTSTTAGSPGMSDKPSTNTLNDDIWPIE